MANIRRIRRRIRSAENISQITKAMEMVAASKMKKAQERAVLGKPYAEKIYELAHELARRTNREDHPLLSLGRESGKTLAVLISTNKGLAGGLNTNLFRAAERWFGEKDIDYVTVGKKSQGFVLRTRASLVADFSDLTPFFQHVGAINSFIVKTFLDGTYKEVYLMYNTFESALKQEPTRMLLLPLQAFDGTGRETEKDRYLQFLIEPTVGDVLDHLLTHYVENQLRSSLHEAEASEHSARMMAMRNATDAALDLIDDLTLLYNKARQEKITNEIADIVTARMAVE